MVTGGTATGACGKRVEFVALGASANSFLSWEERADGTVVVYTEGECTEIRVYKDRELLPCGYQRQEG